MCFVLVHFVLALCVGFTFAAVSDKRLCFDEQCSVPFSEGYTISQYHAPEVGYLSFESGEKVIIYSKSAGNNLDLWGVKIKDRRGYVPVSFIKEMKLLQPGKPEFIIDTEEVFRTQPHPLISPTKSKIVDGTTIYDDFSATLEQKLDLNEQPKREEESKNQNSQGNLVEIKHDDNKQANNMKETKIINENEAKVENNGNLNANSLKTMLGLSKDNTPKTQNAELIQQTIDQHENNTFHEEVIGNSVKLDSNPENITLNETTSEISSKQAPSLATTKTKTAEGETVVNDLHNISTNLPNANAITKDIAQSTDAANIFNQIIEKEKASTEKNEKERELQSIDESKSNEKQNVEELQTTNATNQSLNQTIDNSTITSIVENPIEPSSLSSKTDENKQQPIDVPIPIQFPENKINITEKVDSSTTDEEIKKDEQNIEGETKDTVVEYQENEITNKSNSFNDDLKETHSDETKEDGLNIEAATKHTLIEIEEVTQVAEIITNANTLNENLKEIDAEKEVLLTSNEETKQNGLNIESPTKDTSIETEKNSEVSEIIKNENNINEVEDEKVSSTFNKETKQDEGSIETETNYSSMESEENSQETNNIDQTETSSEPDWFTFLSNWFSSAYSTHVQQVETHTHTPDDTFEETSEDVLLSQYSNRDSCHVDDAHCSRFSHSNDFSQSSKMFELDFLQINDTLVMVSIAGACVVLFLWGYMIIEKLRKEGPLVGKINALEQNLLIVSKENDILTTKLEDLRNGSVLQEINENVSSEVVRELQRELDEVIKTRNALEEQVQTLENELENSTEVGLDLNRMLSEVLQSQSGNTSVMAKMEELQTQLVEQQSIITNMNSKLNEKDTENHELQLELEINNKKVIDLQAELDKMMMNLLKTEEDKDTTVSRAESELNELRKVVASLKTSSALELSRATKISDELKLQIVDVQRKLDVKTKEYSLLRDTLSDSDANRMALEQSALKAEFQQLQHDNKMLNERFAQDQAIIQNFESQVVFASNEHQVLSKRCEDAETSKVEAFTKLEVLQTYFKEKEVELQRELSKHEAMWSEKQGEASSTTERFKFMQEEIQNFKSQIASLQQEIVAQEVELKSQISVLEKKAHDNWVAARHAERRIEDAHQEAAQLRNRLTLRERNMTEEKSMRNGIQLETNGEHLESMIDAPTSPPMLFGTRDHLRTSPPIPVLPPGFPLPPPGVPFMPPLPGMPHFMPPPPAIFPDHRPPPLGRMSSPPPPLNNRYSPDARLFSPSRRTPSPTDDEYYDRDSYYQPRSKRTSSRRSAYSSASNSNESLDRDRERGRRERERNRDQRDHSKV